MAKKKGGVGRHVTKNVPRTFTPNLHERRIWVPELKKFVRIRVTARGMKTLNKNGAYATLKKAGLVPASPSRTSSRDGLGLLSSSDFDASRIPGVQ